MNAMAQSLVVPMPETAADRLALLFDAHYDRLYRLARRLATDPDAARDLVQDTFLRAARSLTSVPTVRQDEEAWLVRVLINIARDAWRRRDVRRRHDVAAPVSATGSDVEAAFVARATVWRALDSLTPRRRAIVVMHELEGLAVPAIAALLGVAEVTVRWHLAKGRRELSRLLTTQGEHHGKR